MDLLTADRDVALWTFWGAVFTVALLYLLGQQAKHGVRW